MKNSTNSKSKRNIMAITILCILGVLSVAYAAFSTNLKIGLQGTADNKWNIQFAAKADNKVDVETLTRTICKSTPVAGTAIWTYTGKQTNISINGLQFVNLDDEIYYLFTIQNTGDVVAKLTTLPEFPTQEVPHSYLDTDSGEDVDYNVTYHGDLYIASDAQGSQSSDQIGGSITNKPDVSTLSTINTPLATGTTLDPGTQKYIILKVYATCDIKKSEQEIVPLNPIPGNTTFTSDTLNFTIDAGTWTSDSTITTTTNQVIGS